VDHGELVGDSHSHPLAMEVITKLQNGGKEIGFEPSTDLIEGMKICIKGL
ncbi:hypothetical protein LCGC14_3150550, partial [marine sediment metagenome]